MIARRAPIRLLLLLLRMPPAAVSVVVTTGDSNTLYPLSHGAGIQSAGASAGKGARSLIIPLSHFSHFHTHSGGAAVMMAVDSDSNVAAAAAPPLPTAVASTRRPTEEEMAEMRGVRTKVCCAVCLCVRVCVCGCGWRGVGVCGWDGQLVRRNEVNWFGC
jgi:hypothetical protein